MSGDEALWARSLRALQGLGPDRRALLGGLGGAGRPGPRRLRHEPRGPAPPLAPGPRRSGADLAPLRASSERIIDITVCLRPFRAAGPRLDAETVGDKLVVHNYGHGGSGWSLSWGSSAIAVRKALAGVARDDRGHRLRRRSGLTSALLAQRAGAQVTIYAKERVPEMRSRARDRHRGHAGFAHRARRRGRARAFPRCGSRWRAPRSRATAASSGLPGDPVEWIDRYILSDTAAPRRRAASARRRAGLRLLRQPRSAT